MAVDLSIYRGSQAPAAVDAQHQTDEECWHADAEDKALSGFAVMQNQQQEPNNYGERPRPDQPDSQHRIDGIPDPLISHRRPGAITKEIVARDLSPHQRYTPGHEERAKTGD